MPKFLETETERMRNWHASLKAPKVAVFDIGTRAARLLAGPKELPKYWAKECFFNSGIETWLGHGIVDSGNGGKRLDLKSQGFKKLVSFVNGLKGELNALGISDVHAIGTAIFRWIENQEEVIERLKKSTGVDLTIISSPMEAEFTLLSLLKIIPRLNDKEKDKLGLSDLSEDDIIAIADQGGGSLEVSWVRWGERDSVRPNIDSVRYEDLGTIALRNRFFETTASGELTDTPDTNQAGIRANTRRILDYATDRIRSDSSLLSVNRQKGKIHLFGVGTALTKPLKGNAWKINGSKYDAEKLKHTVDERCVQFEETNQRVLTLYKAIHGIEGTGVSKWDKDIKSLEEELAILYGLPAYRALLDKIGVDKLLVNGFPLRYGYYAASCTEQSGMPFAPCEPHDKFLFVSYARKNSAKVLPDILRIHTAGYRVVYDEAIGPGENFQAKLGDWLEQATAFVVFVSKEAYQSPEVLAEVNVALRRKLPIIPVAIDKSDPPPDWYRVDAVQRIERADLLDTGFQKLFKRILKDDCRRIELED